MREGPIGVVGSGTMGNGIAEVMAASGRKVILVDTTQELVNRGAEAIRSRMARRVERGRLKQEEMDATMGNVQAVTGLQNLKPAVFVIEAIFENYDVKVKFYKELDGICSKDTIFGSNTSTIPITKLGALVSNPARMVGTHFFNPAPVMKLVEVIRGQNTSQETVDDAVELMKKGGKQPIVVNDSPGFVVNRILGPLLNEACFMLQEGVASRDDIDAALKLGANHPMGPLELADLVGLDIALHTIEILHEEFGDSKYRPAPLLKKMVAAGLLGRKSGKGFYEYSSGTPK